MKKNRKLIIIRGPEGIGKTTIARGLAEHYRKQQKNIAVISADYFFRDIINENETNDLLTFNAIRVLTEFYIENKFDVILEGKLTTRDDSKNTLLKQIVIDGIKDKNVILKTFFLYANRETIRDRMYNRAFEHKWKISDKIFSYRLRRSLKSKLETDILILNETNILETISGILKIVD